MDFVFHLSVTALQAILCASGLGIYGQRLGVQRDVPERKVEQAQALQGQGAEGLKRSPLFRTTPVPLHRRWPGLTLSFCVALLTLLLAYQTLRPFWGLYAENRGDLLLYIAEKHQVPEDKLPLLLAEAEQAYRRAVDIYPHSTAAYLGLGYTQLRQQKYEEGIANVKRALEYVETGEIYNLLGEAYFETGDLKAAEEAFEKSLKLRATGDAHRWLER